MKTILLLLIGASLALTAKADDNSLESRFSGKRNIYFRVVLEKPNGVDMRANIMPMTGSVPES